MDLLWLRSPQSSARSALVFHHPDCAYFTASEETEAVLVYGAWYRCTLNPLTSVTGCTQACLMTIQRPTLITCGMALTALLFSLSDIAAQDTRPKLTTLYTGIAAQAGVVIGSGGVLYGTTPFGGTGTCLEGCGTVFSLTPPASPGGAWAETVIYSFAGGSDGSGPSAGVVIGGGGMLYGTTVSGGAGACDGGCGTVYSLVPPTSRGGVWTETVLYTFKGGIYEDGILPEARVVIGSGGVLYSTTVGSGTSATGTVFSLAPPLSPGWPALSVYPMTKPSVAGLSRKRPGPVSLAARGQP